jgi:hypothetical protein
MPSVETGQEALEWGLHDAQKRVTEVNKRNGWFDEDRTVGDDLSLLHSEVSEMLEAHRDGEMQTWYEHKPGCAHEPLNAIHDLRPQRPGCTCHPKPHGFGPEAGDVLVRLLDTCERRGINLFRSFEEVLAHNATRGYKHGGKAL